MESLGRLGHAALALALLSCIAAGLWWTRTASPLPYLGGGPGSWIEYPLVPRTEARSAIELTAVFRRGFALDAAPGSALLELRAFGRGAVAINGRDVLASTDKALASVEVGDVLRRGDNEIVARVSQRGGPPALSLALSVGGRRIETDARWNASLAGAAWRPARRCGQGGGIAAPLPPPAPGVLLVLALLAAALVALALALARRAPGGGASDAALLVGVCIAWVALLVNNADQYFPRVGFDVRHHLAYVRFVLDQGALPLPADGALMYHPPLFYLLCAGVLWVLGLPPEGPAAAVALRTLTTALGLAHVALLFACVRRLLPARAPARVLTLVFVAFLPMHLYLFSCLTNEALVAVLATGSVYLLIRILQAPAPGAALYAGLGACLGAALLAKVSALVLLPLALAAPLAAHPGRWREALLSGGVALLVGGWHYARVAFVFGDPFVGNWDPVVGFEWWQDPGYRTAGHLGRFGRALIDPWFAGFYGVPDGLYSTFWGDGLASGAVSRSTGPSWNVGLMRQGYWLAAIPGLALAIGAVRGVRVLVRCPSALALFMALLPLAMGAAMFYMTLRVPSYAQAKAFYANLALVPACAAFALGVDWIFARSRRAGWLFAWALALWAANAYASFWILEGATGTLLRDAEKALAVGDGERAHADLVQVLSRAPRDAEVRIGLCRLAVARSAWSEARAHCASARALAPDHPAAWLHSARAEFGGGDLERAISDLRRARELAPDEAQVYALLTQLLERSGDPAAAAAAAREWLRFDPTHPRARALVERGESAEPSDPGAAS